MKLQFSYSMKHHYSAPVTNHYYTLRCLPKNTQRQRIINSELKISSGFCHHEKYDIFGNKIIYGCNRELHSDFDITLCGECETSNACNEHLQTENDFFTDIFSIQSKFTIPGKELKRLYNRCSAYALQLDKYNCALYLMRKIYHYMNYVPNSTTVSTTAEESILKRCGVCQDYAHIMISLCRMYGIPARYVVGMMIGEGASHAWVEVCCGGYWYGMDPTNNLLIDQTYIKLSHGRDYSDTVVLKGLFTNITTQTQDISVSVKLK